jgi:hypothetical protein
MKMDTIKKAIKQDLTASIQYLKFKNFNQLVMMGDRIMSNLLLGEEKELMIVGYLIKELALEFMDIKEEDPVRLNGCMDPGEKLIRDLLQSLTDYEEFNPQVVWDDYCNYKNRIVEFIPPDVEIAVYEKEVDFAGKTTNKLLKLLSENRTLLLDDYNNLLNGILKEYKRVINIYGFKQRDLIIYLLLKAFNGYYLYLFAFKMANKSDKSGVAEKIYYYLDKIIEISADQENIGIKSNKILGELGYQTRLFYIENMDPEKTIKRERGF